MDSAEPGRLLAGRYRLSEMIGQGGMGVVWRASDELLGRDVAVKELVWPATFTERDKQTACRRATREAQLAARLNHRNVILIYDIVQEGRLPVDRHGAAAVPVAARHRAGRRTARSSSGR